jgi:hypothetical protein
MSGPIKDKAESDDRRRRNGSSWMPGDGPGADITSLVIGIWLP